MASDTTFLQWWLKFGGDWQKLCPLVVSRTISPAITLRAIFSVYIVRLSQKCFMGSNSIYPLVWCRINEECFVRENITYFTCGRYYCFYHFPSTTTGFSWNVTRQKLSNCLSLFQLGIWPPYIYRFLTVFLWWSFETLTRLNFPTVVLNLNLVLHSVYIVFVSIFLIIHWGHCNNCRIFANCMSWIVILICSFASDEIIQFLFVVVFGFLNIFFI